MDILHVTINNDLHGIRMITTKRLHQLFNENVSLFPNEELVDPTTRSRVGAMRGLLQMLIDESEKDDCGKTAPKCKVIHIDFAALYA